MRASLPPGTGEYHWTPQAAGYVVLDLGNFGGNFVSGQHVNNRGQILGWASDAAGNAHAYLWEGGPLQDLGLLPGGTFSQASWINQSAQIVGYGDRTDGNVVPFLWENGVMTDLIPLA